jgi:hypothetical protein
MFGQQFLQAIVQGIFNPQGILVPISGHRVLDNLR